MSDRLFVYGTLMFAEVMQRVTGNRFDAEAAKLPGYARYCLRDEVYPGLVWEAGAETHGVLYTGIDAQSLAKLDAFEGELYERISVTVQVGDDEVMAAVYCIAPAHRSRLLPRPWQADEFNREHKQAFMDHV